MSKVFDQITKSNLRVCGKCTGKNKCPDVKNDTFNDCPPFYRRVKNGKEEGCCAPSAIAKLKAVAKLPIASKLLYNRFKEILNVQSSKALKSELGKNFTALWVGVRSPLRLLLRWHTPYGLASLRAAPRALTVKSTLKNLLCFLRQNKNDRRRKATHSRKP